MVSGPECSTGDRMGCRVGLLYCNRLSISHYNLLLTLVNAPLAHAA